MPVPSKMSDLQTLAASNSPSGSDPIGNSLDDYLRAMQAITRSTNANSSATIASASTTDIGSSDGEAVTVTGAATITSLGTTAAGIVREVTFNGVITLTNSSAITMLSGSNYTTAVNDVIRFRSQGSGNWKQVTPVYIGFSPVQQGGGTGQLTNKIYIGWSAGSKLKAQVDTTDLGNIALESFVTGSYLPLSGGTLTGTLNGTLAKMAAPSANVNNVNTFSYLASGSFGGGYGLFDNVAGLNYGLYASGGALVFGFGSGAGISALTGKYTFDPSGNASANNWLATSDKRLKKSVRKVKANDRLADLLELCTWLWKDTGNEGKGVIAQRVLDIAPEYVHKGTDGILGIDKAGLALECVIGLAARVRALESV